jgi:hypothetical protein
VTFVAAAGISSEAAAQAASATDPMIAQLKAEIDQLRAKQSEDDARIQSLEQQLSAARSGAAPSPATPLSDAAQSELRGRGVAGAAPPPVPPSNDTDADRKAPAPTQAVEAVAEAQQNNYGSRFSIDPGFSYTHFTNAKLNLSGFLALDSIFLGLISIDQIDADVLTADVTARYGVSNDLQFDVNVPYIYRRSKFKSGGAGGNAVQLSQADVTSRGLGDVSAGVSYRLMRETARRPDIVFNARLKAPTGESPFGIELVEVPDTQGNLQVPERLSTGTGVWGAAAGVSVLKTIDPMVVFGSLNYYRNFQRHFGDIGEADGNQPGDARLGNAIQYGAGVAFALNDTSSLGLSFTDRLVRATRVRLDSGGGWQPIIGSDANIGILTLGGTFALSNRATLLVNVSHGITNDAPDMTLSVRLPYRF